VPSDENAPLRLEALLAELLLEDGRVRPCGPRCSSLPGRRGRGPARSTRRSGRRPTVVSEMRRPHRWQRSSPLTASAIHAPVRGSAGTFSAPVVVDLDREMSPARITSPGRRDPFCVRRPFEVRPRSRTFRSSTSSPLSSWRPDLEVPPREERRVDPEAWPRCPRPTTSGGPPGSSLNSRVSEPTVRTRGELDHLLQGSELSRPGGASPLMQLSRLEHLCDACPCPTGPWRSSRRGRRGALLLVDLVGALAPDHFAVPLERDDVRRDAVEEIAVVRHDDRAAREVGEGPPRGRGGSRGSRSFVGSSRTRTLPPWRRSLASWTRFRSPPESLPTFICWMSPPRRKCAKGTGASASSSCRSGSSRWQPETSS